MAFELTILGSSSALPTSERYPTAQVLNASGRFFLIDCGEGTQIQIRRQKIAFGKIRHIFISHLHGDHYYGLIGLISTFNLLGIKNDLHIYSPTQLREILQPQLNLLKAGLQFNIIFHPLNFKKPELIFEDKVIEVISFPLKHSINCCGFLFREKTKERNIKKEYIQEFNIPIAQIRAIKQGADFKTENGKIIPNEQLTTPPPPPVSYAFCSDTAFHPPVVETIKEVSTLYHEATFTEEMKEWAVKTYHSTALDAAKIAKMANAGKLIIGHFSSRYKTTEQFLKEAQSEFKNTETAVDGKKYSIKA
jgi:ribonuclease Z